MTRDPTEMELRVAKALFLEAYTRWDNGEELWEKRTANLSEHYVRHARAAIQAMRVPGALLEVGAYTTAKTAADWLGDRLPENFDMTMTNAVTTATWTAMIDAASPRV